MDLETANQLIREYLTEERYEHSIRVAEVAKQLATLHKVDTYVVELAALLHDLMKDQTTTDLAAKIEQFSLPKALLEYHYELWHGPVGAKVVREVYAIENEDIYQAIYHHTTGRAGMTDIELIIYIADYIEPNRNIPHVADVRKLARTSLNEAAFLIASRTIKYLIDKRVTIHMNTFKAYNDLLNRLTKNNF